MNPTNTSNLLKFVVPDGPCTESMHALQKRINSYEESLGDAIKGEHWLLAVDSTVDFAAALIACWNRHLVPWISPETQEGTLAELEQDLSGIITDRSVESSVRTISTPAPSTGESGFNARSPEELALILFTSGTTGRRKKISKTFAQLFDEVGVLESTWGHHLAGLPHFTTVSHHHIYGFLFNVLWPLRCGHPFSRSKSLYWEEVLEKASQTGAVIVSSPAHLRFLPDVAPKFVFNWKKSIVFSSGGPLGNKVANSIEDAIDTAPIEVLGSTETGGIAWRVQGSKGSTLFTPFVNVKVKIEDDEGLIVQSPFLQSPTEWVPTGDLARCEKDGRFALLGRRDRIAKIAGKRVSLTEMENLLTTMKMIDSVRVFQIEADGLVSRSALACVAQVSQDLANLVSSDKSQKSTLVRMAKSTLGKRFEAVAFPRIWRFVNELPTDSQGKTPIGILVDLVKK